MQIRSCDAQLLAIPLERPVVSGMSSKPGSMEASASVMSMTTGCDAMAGGAPQLAPTLTAPLAASSFTLAHKRRHAL